jgi:hypothetical protein
MLRPALELAGVRFIDENGGAPIRLAKRGQGEGKAPCAARRLRTARVALVR